MEEPPAKRARRMDSSTMWDMNDKRPRSSRSPEPDSDSDRPSRRESTNPDGYRKGYDRRYRSRSRDRNDRRRERSRSWDRYDWDRDRDRDGSKRDRERDGRGARERERSTSRDRYHGRRGYPSKSDRYERSRSPDRNGTRHRSRTPPPRGPKADRRDDRRDTRPPDNDRQTNGTSDAKNPSRAKDHDAERDVDMRDIEEDPEDIDALMRKMVGFTKFRSTKNTKVPGNNIYGVRKEKKTVYRQYMNRPGGFNRPLSPTR
ncbi:hypothetical protein VTN77DRAFT_5444 [Rasamsonia byssochlamydoides]|uniref:uncharacterized protein n=1 Tax=Rasamsonia byssochlamydoides TaxID=89139 RepID=UPI003743B279